MRKLTTMLLIASMLCSTTTGINNCETAKAAEITKCEVTNTTLTTAPPNNPNSIEEFKIVEYEDGVVIESYIGKSSEVIIPAEYNGKKVTAIGSQAFYSCSSIKKVVIPENVKRIEVGAFLGCDNLQEVQLPETLKRIENAAFQYCKSLGKIEIPNKVKRIEKDMFSQCTALKTVKLPQALEYISPLAFSETSVEKYILDSTCKKYIVKNGVVYNKKCTQLVLVPVKKDKLKLPKTLTTIGNFAIRGNTELTEVELPNTVKRIKECAFENCTSLNKIKLPKKLEEIESDVFSGCKKLKEIQLPNTVRKIGAYAFEDCISLKKITLPKKVTAIEEYTFSGCEALSKVQIPDSVKTIEKDAFSGCISLKKVKLPKTLSSLTISAFKNTGVKTFVVDSKNSRYKSVDGVIYNKKATVLELVPPKKTVLKLPKTVTLIGDNAASGNTVLKEVKFSDALQKINDSAFLGCTSLKEVVLPKKLQRINAYAFSGCTSLNKVILSKKLQKIEYYAFSDCVNITSIFLPAAVTYMEYDVFLGCTNLKTFQVSSKNQKYSSANNVLYNKEKTVLYKSFDDKETLIIPYTVETILDSTNESLKEIKVEEGNEYFSEYDNALYNKAMTELLICPKAKTSIILPATVVNVDIEKLAVTKLTSVQVEEANPMYSSDNGILYDKNKTRAIFVPTERESVVVPDTITNISN